LRLLRVPNLFTVPGDPIAGFLLAAGADVAPDVSVLWIVAASLLFYAGGLIMNDLVDRPVDARERPDRPLPSGRIHPVAARAVLTLCFVAGVACAASAGRMPLFVALILMIAITGYNLLHRAGPAAALLMGACRGLNVLLGAALVSVWAAPALAAAVLILLFIVSVTILARHEMTDHTPGVWAWAPPGVLLAGLAVFARLADLPRDTEFRMAGAFFFAFALAGLAAWRLREGGHAMAPGSIGLLISALIPLQAALCLASGAGAWSMAAAFLLILLWPLNRWLARSFAAS